MWSKIPNDRFENLSGWVTNKNNIPNNPTAEAVNNRVIQRATI